MMTQYLVVCGTALIVAGLTLLSGFGLGTLLLPAFALFFSIQIAVAATAVVHLANNLFKLTLVGRHADRRVVMTFGLPAAAAAFAGAWVLTAFAGLPPLHEYELGLITAQITVVKIAIAALIIFFALLDLVPALKRITFDRKYLPLGGLISGFFGGLSGHQGSLRAAFLIKLGLSREAFIGTGVMCAVFVDLARLAVYGTSFYRHRFALPDAGVNDGLTRLVLAATICAFVGSFIGARLMKKVTIELIQRLVGGLLILLGIGIGIGLV
ncbi:MAG: sulfite exporter TauE/SafE family protein [Phycisphaerae bacterium]